MDTVILNRRTSRKSLRILQNARQSSLVGRQSKMKNIDWFAQLLGGLVCAVACLYDYAHVSSQIRP